MQSTTAMTQTATDQTAANTAQVARHLQTDEFQVYYDLVYQDMTPKNKFKGSETLLEWVRFTSVVSFFLVQ